MLLVSKRNTRSLARLFSSSRRLPTKRRIETILVQSGLQRIGLHDLGVLFAVFQRMDVQLQTFLINVHKKFEAQLFPDITSRKAIISLNFQVVSTSATEKVVSRIERFQCQLKHHRRVFPDGVKHYRIPELRNDLADDVNALGLKLLQVS